MTSDESEYLRGVKQWYNFSLLSGESFFHTAALNTPWCHNISWANRRLENWQGRLGCSCTKKWVDWCGCSPLVYTLKDTSRLKTAPTDRFFARKFDPRIDTEIVRQVATMTAEGEVHAPGPFYFEVLHRKGFNTASAVEVALYRWLLGLLLQTAGCSAAAIGSAALEYVHGVFTGGGAVGAHFVGFAVEGSHASSGIRGLVRRVDMQTPSSKATRGNLTVRSGWDSKGKVFREHIVVKTSAVHVLLHFLEPPNKANPCTTFNGLLHPDGKACCDAKCGDKCGAFDCDTGTGGSAACCSGTIVKAGNVCRSQSVNAPCKLANAASITTNIAIHWEMMDGASDAKGSIRVPAVPMRTLYDIALDKFQPVPGVWKVSAEIQTAAGARASENTAMSTEILVHGVHTPAQTLRRFYEVCSPNL